MSGSAFEAVNCIALSKDGRIGAAQAVLSGRLRACLGPMPPASGGVPAVRWKSRQEAMPLGGWFGSWRRDVGQARTQPGVGLGRRISGRLCRKGVQDSFDVR